MALISKEVDVLLNGSNIEYFEKIGYHINRIKDKKGRWVVPKNTKITVNVKDLTIGSSSKVDVECDFCKKILNLRWTDYKRHEKENDIYYCKSCSIKLFGSSKTLKTKLLKSKSFEQWCIENDKKDVLLRFDIDLNKCKPNDISYGSGGKFYFKCPVGLHKSELKNINSFTGNYDGVMECKACNSFAQWGIDNICEDFLKKYWDYEKNDKLEINPWFVAKKTDRRKVWIKCQEKSYHDSYFVDCQNFVTGGTRCPYCTNKNGKIHKVDSLGTLYPEVLRIWSNKNKKSPYEYAPHSHTGVWWKCGNGKHEDYKRNINNSNIRDFRCPECGFSKGETKISDYFISNNTSYLPQKEFDNLIGLGGGLLKFDFAVFHDKGKTNLAFLLEYDGEFHYKPIKNYKNEPIKNAEERLRQQQYHDQLKNEYCEKNNIPLLRIPYYDFDNIEQILTTELSKYNLINQNV